MGKQRRPPPDPHSLPRLSSGKRPPPSRSRKDKRPAGGSTPARPGKPPAEQPHAPLDVGGAVSDRVSGVVKRVAQAKRGTRLAADIARAKVGDPTAIYRLGKRVAQSRPVRFLGRLQLRATVAALGVAALTLLAFCWSDTDDQRAAATPHNPADGDTAQWRQVPLPMALAYQSADRVWCNTADGTWDVELSYEPLPPPWRKVDWRLVAAIGRIESAHGGGATVGAFGDLWPPFVGPRLDGTLADHKTIPDTDNGRYDFDTAFDSAVGPMQLLPQTLVSYGIDGNGDGVADPHNVWDAIATAAAYLCLNTPPLDYDKLAAGAPTGVKAAIYAYNRFDWYVDIVSSEYALIAAGVPAGAAPMPPRAPLSWMPRTAAENLPDEVGPVLRSLTAPYHHTDPPAAVTCLDNGCVWLSAPIDPIPWAALRDAGYAAPAAHATPGSVVGAGDGERRMRVPPIAYGGEVAWPVPVATAQQPPRLDTPDWWSAFLPEDDPAWTEPSPDRAVHLPWVIDAPVYAPEAGDLADADSCVGLAAGGWVWQLCGVTEPAAGSVGAGWRVGDASEDTITVTLTDPTGRPACPQSIFDRWQRGLTEAPSELGDQIARLRETAEQHLEAAAELDSEAVGHRLEAAQHRAAGNGSDALASDDLAAEAEAAATEERTLAAEATKEADTLEDMLYEVCIP